MLPEAAQDGGLAVLRLDRGGGREREALLREHATQPAGIIGDDPVDAEVDQRAHPGGIVHRPDDDLEAETVGLVELRRVDTLIHGHFGADRTRLTVRLNGVRSMKSGEVLQLTADPANLHVFDADTGHRLPGA